MQCKWLQIFCLCAAIQFQSIAGNSNGYSSTGYRPNAQVNNHYSYRPDHNQNSNDGAQENINSEWNQQQSAVRGAPLVNNADPNKQYHNQNNGEEAQENVTILPPQQNESSTQTGNRNQKSYSGSGSQSTRHICTIRTEHYDCQIENVHLKNGTFFDFGLEHNNQQNITFKHSTLEYLPKSLIDAFPSMTLLNLNDLMITSIEPHAFSKAANLQTMYLGNNRLTHIPDGTINGARRLTMLVLSENEIKSIGRNTFATNTNLEHLYLDQNQLKALPAFTSTSFLRSLNASHNNIESIDDWHFSKQRYLKSLDVSFNQLKRLNLEQINEHLDLVDVSYNSLTDFRMPRHVTELQASNNSLVELLVGQQCAIVTLNLARNQLNSVPELQACGRMESIDLSQNLLKAFVFPKSMTNLKYLNLAHNHLFEVNLPMKATSPPLSLAFLDLSHNRLSQGPYLAALKNLEFLLLNDNYLISLKTYIDKTHRNFRGYHMANNDWSCDEIPKFQHLTLDKNTAQCRKESRDGICCEVFNKPYNDRLNQILREADLHARSNQEKCAKPVSTPGSQNSYVDEIRTAIAGANSVNAEKLREIEQATQNETNLQKKLQALKQAQERINDSKRNVANEIERQRHSHRVTKEGLISNKEMLERIVKFVQEKDEFNKGLLSRRQEDTEVSNSSFDEKQREKTDLEDIIKNLRNSIQKLKDEEKRMKKEKDQMEKQVNKNAASIHGSSGRISK